MINIPNQQILSIINAKYYLVLFANHLVDSNEEFMDYFILPDSW